MLFELKNEAELAADSFFRDNTYASFELLSNELADV